MTLLKDITIVDNGARFLNVDLHIHSYGASADVKDSGMTPQAIVDSAIRQSISVIAITDHNSNKNVAEAIEHSRQYAGRIMVVAGVEVTTANGHLLAYFAPENTGELGRFLAKLDLVGEMGAENTHTAKSMADVIAEAERLGGICVAAHIDRPKTGFEQFAPGYQNWKKDIVLSPGLYGLECDSVDSLTWYSEADGADSAGTERKKIFRGRSVKPGLEGRHDLAHMQGSDSHSMTQFESPRTDKPWTRMKLTELTWGAFRTALVDPEARVRAKATLPKAIPRVRGMATIGGFLDKEIIHFSDNLNCFIGGRGTGKSTAIRGLAYALGVNEEFAEYDNCPDSVVVYCEDAEGVPYRYERSRGGDPTVKAKEDGTITEVPQDAFRIEYFGQGELAEVAKDPLNAPNLLQDFLDRHTNLADLVETEVSLVSELRENAAQLNPLETLFSQLVAKRESLGAIEKKLKIAEEGNLRDIVKIQSSIASEKAIRDTVERVAQEYRSGITLAGTERAFASLVKTAGEVSDDATSKALLASMRSTFEASNAMLRAKAAEVNIELKKTADSLAKQVRELKANHSRMEAELSVKIAELKSKGLAGNLAELEVLLRQKSTLGRDIASIEQRRPELSACRDKRKILRADLAKVRTEMTARRKGQLKSINQNLSVTLRDYTVFVTYDDAGITDEFEAFLRDKMTGSYFQDQSIRQLCDRVTPSDLADWVHDRNVDLIASKAAISAEWAQQVVGKLCYWSHIFDLQALSKQPKPVITVQTKSNPTRSIPVVQLSDGQRHTILLTIAVLADSNVPLVIDQPEDDLDNAFIFTSIVTTLRAVKERRQVILVTHNANIAVLGDSELLLPMRRERDCGEIFERGSIDGDATKRSVQDILEGGPAAFARRRQIYGH